MTTANTGVSNPEPDASKTVPEPDASTSSAQADTLDAAAVARYLQQNPAFFDQHSELLMQLSIPHESGKAVSLLERQVSVFRARQEQLETQFHEIISNARENDELFEKTRLVILDLLHSDNLPTLIATIEETIKTDFDATASSLVFVSDQVPPLDANIKSLPLTAVRTALGEFYQKQRTYCGPVNKVQCELLFEQDESAAPIICAAIVPLHLPEGSIAKTRYGLPLLLLGSSQEHHFNSSLDTLFLDFIGEVLAAHLHNLIAGA